MNRELKICAWIKIVLSFIPFSESKTYRLKRAFEIVGLTVDKLDFNLRSTEIVFLTEVLGSVGSVFYDFSDVALCIESADQRVLGTVLDMRPEHSN